MLFSWNYYFNDLFCTKVVKIENQFAPDIWTCSGVDFIKVWFIKFKKKLDLFSRTPHALR